MPLPTAILRSRLMIMQVILSAPHARALLNGSFPAPRLSLTAADPWLPDGVPVLTIDGLPTVILSTGFALLLIGPPTQDDQHPEPVPFGLRRVEDLSAALHCGDLYQPRTDAAFHALHPERPTPLRRRPHLLTWLTARLSAALTHRRAACAPERPPHGPARAS
ncbi:hypothetical protein [Deinococcus soli (ex Cha et al. 2016)]|uniref:Uncharacterized protein n=2 Tax=Deinococcus soli (ex Cha et al. 2016) TaxID=1309411 RepID=A0ACC6KG70_9DEIO|nr:hypothetical protein [Deinococcus soli (ex Cha et al. 2016)]MDR6218414.1 hypothetical protein [Deinococcus soli (ex Cha et al. 2016)]MDR6329154.1 hypothetical protein [Deinococcus soli (ex Cha et al. 2016)]MDR6751427.1 hypothetical protein [Deinococcus soli (ex Cha et al. 2016)]